MESVSKFITVNGLKLHYLEFGDAANPAIVCIHGLTRSAHDFDALAPHLAGKYRVLSLDVRGRGDSAWGPPHQYNIAAYAADLTALLDQLKLARVSLIGTSMGGRISILYSGAHPERVEKLVLNDIGPALNPEASARINQWVASAPIEFASLDDAMEHYRAVQFGPADADFAAMLKWLVKPSTGGRLTWKMDPAIRKPPSGTSAVLPIGFWAEFEKITVPILIVRGAVSTVLMPETVQRMCQVSSEARAVEVPGVGHAPSLVEPEALNALRAFFGC
ncbi:MAG TPA: alpha/beta hydrolase [Candidatus Binataceae bacterium]|nr:alpha/beta hydrolase [Candidatus Binataceae bacterium]